MERLVDILRLMALPAEEQRAAFPDYVNVPDEIATLFCDQLRLASRDGAATRETFEAMEALDARLAEMSAEPAQWTDDAFVSSREWQEIRETARDLLIQVGAGPGRPMLTWLAYVKG